MRGKGLRKVKGGTKVVPEEVGRRAVSSVAGRTISNSSSLGALKGEIYVGIQKY